MHFSPSTVYYFFSTAAQAYAAVLAIFTTLLLFRVQRLVDKTKSDRRAVLEKFIEEPEDHPEAQAAKKRIRFKEYWCLGSDQARATFIKDSLFQNQGNIFLLSRDSEKGEVPFPPSADSDFLRTLWIRLHDLDMLEAVAGKTKRRFRQTFLLGVFLVIYALASITLPSVTCTSASDCLIPLWGWGSLIPLHFLGGVLFFYMANCAFDFAPELMES